MAVVLASIFVIGLLAGLFVPKLPLGVPRRGFDIYTWIAVFHGDEMEGDRDWRERRDQKNMDLRDIEKNMGDVRFRYHVLEKKEGGSQSDTYPLETFVS